MVKVGDKVRITKSNTNWCCSMDEYHGKIVIVTEVLPYKSSYNKKYMDTSQIKFENDGGHWWIESQKHFEIINNNYELWT